jgi:copper(I)-binding protein
VVVGVVRGCSGDSRMPLRGKFLARFGFAGGVLAAVAAAWLGVMAKTSRTDIQIEDAWVQETNEWRAALHLKIVSTGRVADRIVRGSTLLGKRVAFFDQFGQPSKELLIPADSNWVLGDGAPRVELVGLPRQIKSPSSFAVLLVFGNAGKIWHTVRVEAASPVAESTEQ